MAVRQVVEQLLNKQVLMKLNQDNMAAVHTIVNEVTSWRTRHYSTRASWIRDMVVKEDIEVAHQSGIDIVADGLTKVLPRIKLVETRQKLQLVSRL